MSNENTYKRFLAVPSIDELAPNASAHYVTTLVTFNSSDAIVKHLKTQTKQLKKKEEKILDIVDGGNAIAVEIQTTIEFITSGGAYLPGLDDNFLADRTVTIPIIHIVSFDSDHKITQIRQSWDQGSLLKLIDVIGKTGRNWPIRDGKDQIKLIENSVKLAGKKAVNSSAPTDNAAADEAAQGHARKQSMNVTRDPHSSLSLFAPREDALENNLPAVVAPRASAAPPPREYSELFAGSEDPAADRAIQPKAGGGKNFQANRLFDNDENSPIRPREQARGYIPHPTKFNHFDFADGSDSQDGPIRPTMANKIKSQNGASWDFDSFQTPQKAVPTKTLKAGQGNEKSWGNEEMLNSPLKRPIVPKPRKDQGHFTFEDATPENERRVNVISRPAGAGNGLYRDPVFDIDAPIQTKSAGPLSNITNVKDRRKDFDPHFELQDDSPAGPRKQAPLAEDKAKAVNMMNSNWSSYDQSPVPTGNQKENKPPAREIKQKGITIAGDGMGSRKGIESATIKLRGINIGGDGMGGAKGSAREWGFGDESDGEEIGGANARSNHFQPGKAQLGEENGGGGDFWNH